MSVMEKFGVPEPQWILDRVEETGYQFWRRDSLSNKTRVKFRCDVDVREFQRADHELEEEQQQQPYFEEQAQINSVTMAFTAIICISISVLLPLYIIGLN